MLTLIPNVDRNLLLLYRGGVRRSGFRSLGGEGATGGSIVAYGRKSVCRV